MYFGNRPAGNWLPAGLFLFIGGVRWAEPSRSGTKKGGRRGARPKAIESSSQQIGLVHHAHGVPNLGQGLLGDLVGATVALVQDVLHIVQIVLVALATLADRR